jgi:putative Mn2+ efflux pump MntP
LDILQFLLIGIGLSMDAAAVAICNSLAYSTMSKAKKLAMPLSFGFFQGLMPLLGFLAGSLFVGFISRYAGIIQFVILAFIGAKMIKDSFSFSESCNTNSFSYKLIFIQSIATSIDAFAVGVGFAASASNIYLASPIIAVVTFVTCTIASFIGRKFGCILGARAQLLGGVILVTIGIRSVI